MEGEDNYSMLSEEETGELQMVLLEYNVRREIEENVLEDEPDSSEGDSEDEDDELPFEFSEAQITKRSKVEAFVRETCGCKLTEQETPCSSAIPKEEFIDCRNNCITGGYPQFYLNSVHFTLLFLLVSGFLRSSVSKGGQCAKNFPYFCQKPKQPFAR